MALSENDINDEINIATKHSWLPPCFLVLKITDNHICGIVSNKEELDEVIHRHSLATTTTFAKWSDDIRRKEKLEKKRLFWSIEDLEDNVPMSVDNRVILACQYGKVHVRQRQSHKDDEKSDLLQTKRPSRVRKSMKVNCPAKILIRYITRYEAFRVKAEVNKVDRQFAMESVAEFLEKKLEMKPPPSVVIHVKLPMLGAHQNHSVFLKSSLAHCVLPSVGVPSVSHLKRLLKRFQSDVVSRKQRIFEVLDEHEDDPGYHHADLFDNLSEVNKSEHECVISEDFESIANAQTNFREALKRLEEQSYVCFDKETIVNATEDVENLCKQLSESTPKQEPKHPTSKREEEQETISIHHLTETDIPDEKTLHVDGTQGSEPSVQYNVHENWLHHSGDDLKW